MTDIDETEDAGDGRAARRQRNVDTVLDVVIEMFGEELHWPTIEQASKRSGLSLRSLYRYFGDAGELVEGAIKRQRELARDAGHISAIGKGPFEDRLDVFVDLRVTLYERFGPVFRATIHNAPQHPRVNDELFRNREQLRTQFEKQFEPELQRFGPDQRRATIAACDVLSQVDSIDTMRRHHGLTPAEVTSCLRSALSTMLLDCPSST